MSLLFEKGGGENENKKKEKKEENACLPVLPNNSTVRHATPQNFCSFALIVSGWLSGFESISFGSESGSF